MSEHASHHRHLGDFEKDKDLKNLLGLGITEQTPVTTHIKRAVTLAHLPWYLTVTLDAPEDPLVVRMCRWLYLGALVSFAITGDFAPLFLYYLLPFMTSYQVFRYLSDAMDHAGIVTQKEEFLRSRNHIFKNKLWNMLVFPRNDAYHLIHHLFPRLPTRSFPKAHALLLKDTAYAARNHSINKDEASALP